MSSPSPANNSRDTYKQQTNNCNYKGSIIIEVLLTKKKKLTHTYTDFI